MPWPTTAWPVGPLPAGVSPEKLEAALAVVAKPQPRLGETRAVVIIHRGKLVTERYMPGYGPDTPLLSWSMAKSITQAMVGIAVRRGLVDIDKPMGNPHWPANDARAQIPWHNWIVPSKIWCSCGSAISLTCPAGSRSAPGSIRW